MAMTNAAQRHRIFVSRVLISLVLAIVLLTRLSWPERALGGFAVENAGFILITVGAFGRMWAALYIAGKKSKELVTVGPYSVSRNPLYFSSLLLGLGIVASLQNLLLLVPLAFFHITCYFLTILGEERDLAVRFGSQYEDYRRRVPRLLPAFWKYRRGGDLEGWVAVRETRVLKSLFESALFILIIPFSEIIEELHIRGILPLILKH
jgi:protein-S-isoprenylcysteine O-methyltransferase Ste14